MNRDRGMLIADLECEYGPRNIIMGPWNVIFGRGM